MKTLPYRQIVAVDFEYSAPDGELPYVVCMVAKELRTGKTWRIFRDQLLILDAPHTA